jgi:hypothetical protein
MNKRILPLIGMVLLSGSAAAQESVLYENPYNPAGGGDCSFSGACSFPGTVQDAQSFTLSSAATIQAVSIIVSDYGPAPNQTYNWSIYAAAGGLPTGPPATFENTGRPTVLPIVLGEAFGPGSGQPDTYSYLNVIPSPDPSEHLLDWVNEVTIDTNSVTLGPGTYFFAVAGLGPSIRPENWDQGINNTGSAISNYGVWSTNTQVDGFAMTVIGTKAPEIDPSSAMSALTLLLGGLMVLRGRRGE